MWIINLTPNENGAYCNTQTWTKEIPPEGFAEVRCDAEMLYEYNGFVTLETVQESVSLDDGSAAVVEEDAAEETEDAAEEDTAATEDAGNTVEITVVIGMTPNVEAWEEWKSSLPEPEPEPTVQELTAKVQELTAENQFLEDCIAEMASIVYA